MDGRSLANGMADGIRLVGCLLLFLSVAVLVLLGMVGWLLLRG